MGQLKFTSPEGTPPAEKYMLSKCLVTYRLFIVQWEGQDSYKDSMEQHARATKSKSIHAELASGRDTKIPALHVVCAKQSDNLYPDYSSFNSIIYTKPQTLAMRLTAAGQRKSLCLLADY